VTVLETAGNMAAAKMRFAATKMACATTMASATMSERHGAGRHRRHAEGTCCSNCNHCFAH